jgi:hypothetical protein
LENRKTRNLAVIYGYLCIFCFQITIFLRLVPPISRHFDGITHILIFYIRITTKYCDGEKIELEILKNLQVLNSLNIEKWPSVRLSESELLYDGRFTANQFVLASNPLRITTSNFIFQLKPCSYSPHVTSSLTRR